MVYGITYNGSKNRIAKEIIDLLPTSNRLVDLFCGGCAVAHAGALSGKYQIVHLNDLDSRGYELFLDGVKGTLEELPYMSYEDWEKNQNSKWSLLWSFCGDGKWYNSIAKESYYKELYFNRYLIDKNNRHQPLERWRRVSKIKCPDIFTYSNLSYNEVELFDGDIIYCDIPYKNTHGYKVGEFNYDKFYQWCEDNRNKYQIYVSEYNFPLGNCIWEKSHKSMTGEITDSVEKLFKL